MKTVTQAHAEHELAQLAQRFDYWRHSRPTPRPRIPQALWDQAVALTAVLPVSRVAKRLRLGTHDLKQHCAAKPLVHPAETTPGTLGFVEVTAASAWPSPLAYTELELQRADGARLRMHTPELPLSIVALVRTFLETV